MSALFLLGAASLLAQSAAAAPKADDTALDPIAIVGATVWTMDGAALEGATVLFRDGKIVAVGKDIEIPGRARRIDGAGKVVTPGFLDASTSLGLTEIDLGAPATVEDRLDDPNPIHAAFRAVDGLNPRSQLIAVTRMEGVTGVVARPQGGIVSGQSAWLRLAGASIDEMVVAEPVAMQAMLGEEGRGAGGKTRGGAIRRLREALDDARLLRSRPGAADENRMRALSASRLDLLALGQVIDRKIPLVIRANQASDLQAALRLAREEKIRIVLEGAAEGWRVAGEIAAAKVPVLVQPMTNLPGSFESLGARYENAAMLEKAGVTVAIVTGDAHNVRKLRQGAGLAVANGMTRDGAMAAVTRTPAQIFGVDDRLGTLKKGMAADLVVWSGDPFELTTDPVHVFINGREIPRTSRQTDLLKRYRTLPPAR